MKAKVESSQEAINRERRALLRQVDHALEVPMVALGFVWLALLVWELTAGVSRTVELIGIAIWVVFVLEFAVKLLLAPAKLIFLRRQWLTLLSLAVPALRVFRIARIIRIFRMARAARGIRLFRLMTSLNRGLKSLRATMRRRGFGYVLAISAIITFAGAAGMFAFERDQAPGLPTYGAALWWTAMMMTTVASDYFPRSAEGRVLCFILATAAFTLWGYLTASLATFFVGRDASAEKEGTTGADLHSELQALRAAVEQLSVAARPRGPAADDSPACSDSPFGSGR